MEGNLNWFIQNKSQKSAETRKKKEKVAQISDRTLGEYERVFGIDLAAMKDKLVLDIGSGLNEKFSKEASLQKGVKVVSMNPSPKNDTWSAEFFQDWQGRSVVGRGQQMPYGDNMFDCEVALTSVPFYLPFVRQEYEVFFGEVIRTLKPSGKAYFFPVDKNYHSIRSQKFIKRFVSKILDQFSDSTTYEFEPIDLDHKKYRLVITKKLTDK